MNIFPTKTSSLKETITSRKYETKKMHMYFLAKKKFRMALLIQIQVSTGAKWQLFS